jgi:hypothetical protein
MLLELAGSVLCNATQIKVSVLAKRTAVLSVRRLEKGRERVKLGSVWDRDAAMLTWPVGGISMELKLVFQ